MYFSFIFFVLSLLCNHITITMFLLYDYYVFMLRLLCIQNLLTIYGFCKIY